MDAKRLMLPLAVRFAKRPTRTTAATVPRYKYLMDVLLIIPTARPNAKRHTAITAETGIIMTMVTAVKNGGATVLQNVKSL